MLSILLYFAFPTAVDDNGGVAGNSDWRSEVLWKEAVPAPAVSGGASSESKNVEGSVRLGWAADNEDDDEDEDEDIEEEVDL